jgi:hypothetical protein
MNLLDRIACAALLATTLPALAVADEAALRGHVEYLASQELEGRLTGTDGERLAAEYLTEQLRAMGAEPLAGRPDFLHPFEFVSGMKDNGSVVVIETATKRVEFLGADVAALSFSGSGEVSGPAVFAGYGIKMPTGADFPYDSYQGLDLNGKVAVILRYFPEDAEKAQREELSRYSGLRFKALHAREAGAVGLLVLTGPNSPNAGSTVPLGFDTAVAGSGVVGASASGAVADALFGAVGKSLQEVQTSLDSGNPHVAGFDLEGVTVTVAADIERERRTGNNVIARFPVEGAAESVVIGGHFDHLGHGGGGNSLAGSGDEDKVHPGADDNASGVAAVLEAARRLAGQPRTRHLVVAFWSGEELGLVGSQAFIDDAVVPKGEIAAYVNLDMVGRVENNRLSAQGTGSSPEWASMIEKANLRPGFDLAVSADPYLPTDASVFYQAGVPVLSLFSGAHEDYHKPSDTAEKLNYEALERVALFTANVGRQLLTAEARPPYAEVARTASPAGGGRMGRITTGTIPDYAAEVEGLKLGGVMKDGPAEKAGLLKGDVVVELAGQKVANIYDYMYALEGLKVGQPVGVVVLRGEERLTFELVPAARK